jgi:hypothetical protein
MVDGKPITPLPDRISRLNFLIEGITETPSAYARHEADAITAAMRDLVRELNRMDQETVPSLNRQLAAQRLKPIKPPAALPAPR